MAAKKSSKMPQCVLTDDEYKRINKELEHIDYLSKMGRDSSEDPGAVECATSLISERSDNIGELLSRAGKNRLQQLRGSRQAAANAQDVGRVSGRVCACKR